MPESNGIVRVDKSSCVASSIESGGITYTLELKLKQLKHEEERFLKQGKYTHDTDVLW